MTKACHAGKFCFSNVVPIVLDKFLGSDNLNLAANYLTAVVMTFLGVYFQIVGEMFAGDSFGEFALLHDIKRTATIICKGTAEFLTVDKPDFDMVYTHPFIT